MTGTGVIERTLVTGMVALVLSHGAVVSASAVEVPRPDRVVPRESSDDRVWRACRAYGERALPVIEIEVGGSAADAHLAGAAVLFALKIREQQLRAFTTTCMRAAGLADADASTQDALTAR
jgi:hypothetical protein